MVACTLILLYFVKLVALAGFALMLTSLVMARFFQGCRKRMLQKEEGFTDRRIKLVADMIAGIRTIKAYAWEDVFERKIEKVREK